MTPIFLLPPAADIGLRAFYGALRPMPPMRFGRIDSRYAADLHLSTYFPQPAPRIGFSGRKSPFSRLCRAFARNVIFCGESYFPDQI